MSVSGRTHFERLGELTDKLEDAFEQAAADQADAVMDLVRELVAENEDLTARVVRLEQAIDHMRDRG